MEAYWMKQINRITNSETPTLFSMITKPLILIILVSIISTISLFISFITNSSSITPAFANEVSCMTSSQVWQNVSISPQKETFTVEFDAIPEGDNINALTMLSSGPGSQYTDYAALIRFNIEGFIDVRNYDQYSSDVDIPYASGTSYHFQAQIDISTHTYSVWVTPSGTLEPIALASDYSFRDGQDNVGQIDNWGLRAGSGSHQVCNFIVSDGANIPPSSQMTLMLDGPASVNAGETFNVTAVAQDVPDPGLYGVQLEINYDPTLISVSDLQFNPNLIFVVLNDVDNTTGKIRLAASQQGKVPGLTGDVALLSFNASAANTAGTVVFTVENEKFSDSQAQGFDFISQSYSVSIGEMPTPEPTDEPTVEPTLTPEPTDEPTAEPTDTPTPTPVPTDEPTSEPTDEPTVEPTLTPEPTDEPTAEPTDTPTPTPVPTDEPTMVNISGQVILAGRAGNDWSGAIVTIEDSGQTGTTDTTGNFSIANAAISSLSAITADAPGYLSAVCTGLTITDPETVLDSVSLLSGDIDGDNQVDITDATAVGASFGQTGSGLPADITRDGLLDIFDIVLVSVNFGEKGPQSWSCLVK
jgi:hypothetical protein